MSKEKVKEEKVSEDIKNYKSIKTSIATFKSLLDDISTLEDKKKSLWLEIYQNAVFDREMAIMLFDLLILEQSKNGNNITIQQFNGPIFSKYIERMTRANDQLIKLAELVEKAQQKEETIDANDIYQQLDG